MTVIERNEEDETVLMEHDEQEEEGDLDETITRMLESSEDEEEDGDRHPNDALSSLLKSFGNTVNRKSSEIEEQQEEGENLSNVSMDVFGESEGDEETADGNMLLAVDIPVTERPPIKKVTYHI